MTNDLTAAVAEIQSISIKAMPFRSSDFEGFTQVRGNAVATILNAVASGELIPAADVQGLVEAAKKLQADMLDRARTRLDTIHGEEYKVVNAGNGAWQGFCKALAKLENRNG